MIHVQAVREFVHDDVLHDFEWGVGESPVERDGAGTGTTSPTRSGVTKAQLRNFDFHILRVFL